MPENTRPNAVQVSSTRPDRQEGNGRALVCLAGCCPTAAMDRALMSPNRAVHYPDRHFLLEQQNRCPKKPFDPQLGGDPCPKLQEHLQIAAGAPANILPHSVLLRIETNSVPCHECSKRPLRSLPSTQWRRATPSYPRMAVAYGESALCSPDTTALARPFFLPQKLQLPVNCRNARDGCADFVHSCSWVAKPRCSLYVLIAAVAWRTAGMIGAVLKVRSLSALVRGVGS